MYTLILNSPSCKKTTISFTYRSNNYGTNHSSYVCSPSYSSCYQLAKHIPSWQKCTPSNPNVSVQMQNVHTIMYSCTFFILNSPSCKKTIISFTYRSNNYGTNHSSYTLRYTLYYDIHFLHKLYIRV